MGKKRGQARTPARAPPAKRAREVREEDAAAEATAAALTLANAEEREREREKEKVEEKEEEEAKQALEEEPSDAGLDATWAPGAAADAAAADAAAAAAAAAAASEAADLNPLAAIDTDVFINADALVGAEAQPGAAGAPASAGAAAAAAAPRPERFKLPKRGQKDFEPRGTPAEAVALEEARASFRQVLQDERKCAVKTLSHAVWDHATRTAVVTQMRGTHFVSMGHHYDGRVHLLAEEAAFLVDRSNLLLLVDGQPASYQYALALALDAGVSMDEYLVYAHMKRLGFVVNRTGLPWHDLPPAPAPTTFVVDDDVEGLEDLEDTEDTENLEGAAMDANVPAAPARRPRAVAGGVFTAPFRTIARVVADATTTALSWMRRLIVPQPQPPPKPAPPTAAAPPAVVAPPAPAANIPAVQPLFDPAKEQLTTTALYQRMQIIKHGQPTPTAVAAPRRPHITFDIYRPNRKFSKRTPPPVSFKVVVQSITDTPPDAYALERIFAEAAGVPLKLAVVQCGSLSFYSWLNLRINDVTVPLVPTSLVPSPTPAELAARASARTASAKPVAAAPAALEPPTTGAPAALEPPAAAAPDAAMEIDPPAVPTHV